MPLPIIPIVAYWALAGIGLTLGHNATNLTADVLGGAARGIANARQARRAAKIEKALTDVREANAAEIAAAEEVATLAPTPAETVPVAPPTKPARKRAPKATPPAALAAVD
jgi:hypothetical protein